MSDNRNPLIMALPNVQALLAICDYSFKEEIVSRQFWVSWLAHEIFNFGPCPNLLAENSRNLARGLLL